MSRASRRRRIIAASLAIFWLAMMGLLLWREAPRWWAGSQQPRGLLDAPVDVWYGVYAGAGEERIGHAHISGAPAQRGDDHGFDLRVEGRLMMSLLGEHAQLAVDGTAFIIEGRGVPEFQVVASSGPTDISARGSIENGMLSGTFTTGGTTLPLALPLGESFDFSRDLGLASGEEMPTEPGQVIEVVTPNPLTGQMETARFECLSRENITIAGQEYEAVVVLADFNRMKMKNWITEDGRLLRASLPWGLELRMISPEDAAAPVEAGAGAALLEMSAVRPSGLQPQRGAARMRFRVTGLPPDVALPEDDAQRQLEPGLYETWPQDQAALLRPLDDPQEFLAADPIIQSSHPIILKQAQEIAAASTGDVTIAHSLYDWVFKNLKKTAVPALPSALEVLETREGDCNEHTILFTALARAAGLPTRIALGLVWSEELGGFYYHAWPEVWLGRWVWIDPTLGQFPADATHIKLFTGSIDQWMRLVDFLGNIEIEVLELEPAA